MSAGAKAPPTRFSKLDGLAPASADVRRPEVASAVGAGKILLVTSNFPPVLGGSASVYANLADHLGSKLTVLAPTHDYADGLKLIGWREHDRATRHRTIRLPLLRTTLNPPARLRRKWMVRLWDLSLRAQVLWQIMRCVLFDRVRIVCIGELLSGQWLTHVLRFVPGVRTVVYVHGEEITTILPTPQDRQRAERSLLLADRIIVVSSFTFAALKAMLSREAARRVVLIQNGVDCDRFEPGPKSRILQQAYNLENAFVFLSVSRLVEKKGHDNAIRAFAVVAARYPDARFLIVGVGPDLDRLIEIRASLGLAERVTFLGAVSDEDLVSHYRLADVFVMANRKLPDGDTEGFGLVFLEANSCGLPVIAGKDGGSPEAVDDHYNGLVVDGYAVDEIAAAMLALRSDPELRARLRANGLIRAAQSGWSQKARLFERACRTP